MLVETGQAPPPQRVFAVPEVRPGWLVLDNDQQRIGKAVGWISALDEPFLVVHRTLHPTLYVPTSAIGAVCQGTVSLNVPKKWVGSMNWTEPPRTGVDETGNGGRS